MRSQIQIQRHGPHGQPRAGGTASLPTVQDAYRVRRPNDNEAISWNLYDSCFYVTGGQSQLQFFSAQVGQLFNTGAGNKTYSDTNMTLSGQISAGNAFLIQRIEVEYIYGLSSAATFTAGALPSVASLGTATADTAANDNYKFRTTGNLVLTVLAKPYMQEGPLYKFPCNNNFEVTGAASDSTTAAATGGVRTISSFVRGPAYNVSPLLLDANVSFGVSLNWPEGVITVTTAAKVYVRLCGILFRNVQ